MRWLVIGDMHYKTNNGSLTSRLENIILSIAGHVDFIILLGDLAHNFNVGEMRVMHRIYNFIRRLRELIPVYIIIGNHDRENNRDFMTDIHFFGPYKHWEGITIIDKTTVCEISGHKFAFVPYVPDGRFKDALGGLNLQQITSLFCHQTFKICSPKGDPIPNGTLIVSGHWHNQMRKDNLVYIGSPYQVDGSELPGNIISIFELGESVTLELPLPLSNNYVHNHGQLIAEASYLTKLTSKRTDIIELSELDNYNLYLTIDIPSDLRVKVRLQQGQLPILKCHPIYIDMIGRGVKIVPLIINSEVQYCPETIFSFREEIEQTLSVQELEVFNSLF